MLPVKKNIIEAEEKATVVWELLIIMTITNRYVNKEHGFV
jgi:hypothetical protein